MAYNYYQNNISGWGTNELQFGPPPPVQFQPQPSWSGLDFYRAHANSTPDPTLFNQVNGMIQDGSAIQTLGVGLNEARAWHRRAFGGLGQITQMTPQEVGHAAAYEAYRVWIHNSSLYEPIGGEAERQREALVGLAVAEASRLYQLSARPVDNYGHVPACEAAAATAALILQEISPGIGMAFGGGANTAVGGPGALQGGPGMDGIGGMGGMGGSMGYGAGFGARAANGMDPYAIDSEAPWFQRQGRSRRLSGPSMMQNGMNGGAGRYGNASPMPIPGASGAPYGGGMGMGAGSMGAGGMGMGGGMGAGGMGVGGMGAGGMGAGGMGAGGGMGMGGGRYGDSYGGVAASGLSPRVMRAGSVSPNMMGAGGISPGVIGTGGMYGGGLNGGGLGVDGNAYGSGMNAGGPYGYGTGGGMYGSGIAGTRYRSVSPYGGASPVYGGASPMYGGTSPLYGGTGPGVYGGGSSVYAGPTPGMNGAGYPGSYPGQGTTTVIELPRKHRSSSRHHHNRRHRRARSLDPVVTTTTNGGGGGAGTAMRRVGNAVGGVAGGAAGLVGGAVGGLARGAIGGLAGGAMSGAGGMPTGTMGAAMPGMGPQVGPAVGGPVVGAPGYAGYGYGYGGGARVYQY
ncbi:hypothetical protein BJ138DRAFT_1176725 [Hygrophoropsis aurantiaca]|uniref:Uncharacterized protein n=1 Tax=Hygrophoropsis aurantiaca TaxID=72124 RepID=A0ACB8APN7_9AGAM|nr:hypothetical protein BJ138DRAFT_1176725 [Hygrophoropsis aurantiaca]